MFKLANEFELKSRDVKLVSLKVHTLHADGIIVLQVPDNFKLKTFFVNHQVAFGKLTSSTSSVIDTSDGIDCIILCFFAESKSPYNCRRKEVVDKLLKVGVAVENRFSLISAIFIQAGKLKFSKLFDVA